MDNFRKVLSIVLLTLLIISAVFTLFKKVGLCAESSDSSISYNPPPLLYGNGIGLSGQYSDSLILNIVDDAITRKGNFVSGNTVIVYPFNYNNAVRLDVCFPSSQTCVPINDYYSQQYFLIQYSQVYSYYTTGSFANSYSNGQVGIFLDQIHENVSGGEIYIQGAFAQYPIYVYNPENYLFSDGTQVFSNVIDDTPVGPIGHSKGGVLSNFIDSEDLIEDSSEVKKVDKTPPSDSSSIPAWLQKILNGLGVLNGSIQSGVLTIGDYIGQFKEELLNKLNEIFSLDSDAVDSAWEDAWESSDVYTLVTHFKSMHNGILSIVNVSPADTLSFTIDMYPITIPNLNGGSSVIYLFGRSVTLDFSWYKSALFGGRTIQDIVLAVLLPFLYVGFIMSLFFKSPAIISGASGFASNVKEISNRSSGWAPTSNGIFTTGVSNHQPSLDLPPLSGFGGSSESYGIYTTGVSRHQPSLDKSPLTGGGLSGLTSFWY